MCRKATKRSAPFHSALPSEVLCLSFPAMHKRRREERDARATPRETHRECREEKETRFSSAAPFLLRTQLGGREGGRESCSVERAPSRLLLLLAPPRKEKSTKRRNDITKSRKRKRRKRASRRGTATTASSSKTSTSAITTTSSPWSPVCP